MMVSAIVEHASDLTSLSDELHHAAQGPAELAHLGRDGANVLRGLEFPAGAAVLEFGAGCGPLTRYLGERVRVVHAVESDETKAAIAAARTGDLDSVQVHGDFANALRAEPAYDVIVSGVFPDPSAIGAMVAALRKGGVLCVGGDNSLSITALQHGTPATASSAWESYQERLQSAGLTPISVLGCHSDLRTCRLIFKAELTQRHPRLAVELSGLADGAKDLWRSFVEAGRGLDAAGGFLLIASKGPADIGLWPDDRLGSYFNMDRAARWCTRTDIVRVSGSASEVRRVPLSAEPAAGPISIQPWADQVLDAPTLVAEIVHRPGDLETLLQKWRAVVLARADELGGAAWDLVPHNVLLGHDGTCYPIDLEWRVAGVGVEQVLDRGLLLLADQLARANWRGAGEGNTVGDLARWLGALLGRQPDFIAGAVEREARFQAARISGDAAGLGYHRILGEMRDAWDDRLVEEVRSHSTPSSADVRFHGDELDLLTADVMARASVRINTDDTMFRGNRKHYFKASESALRNCLLALLSAHRSVPQRVLDFGCGYGRVLRALRAAFPSAEIIASDVEPAAVEFCRTTFNAVPLASYPDISAIDQVTEVDLIWSGSVMTHLDQRQWDAVLTYFKRALSSDGVVVMTTHGRRSERRLRDRAKGAYGLGADEAEALLAQYQHTGFGYADYPAQQGYGISLSTPAWVSHHVLRRDFRLLGYIEAGWDDHQDVVVLTNECTDAMETSA